MNNKKLYLIFFFCLFFLQSFALEKSKKLIQKENVEKKIVRLSQGGGVLLHTPKEQVLFQYQANNAFIPASVLKIIIVSAAFDLLGENFFFSTSFYRDKNQNLLVKGGGDPFLISEEIDKIAIRVKKRGFLQFNSIFLDDSLIETSIVPGLGKSNNSYNALSGALVVNFNSLYLEKTATGKVLSAEAWTPLTPFAKRKGVAIAKGKKKRIKISNSYTDTLQYTAELIEAIFENHGINVVNSGYQKTLHNQDWDLILNYQNSRKLKELISLFLLYSNNYIANQIYFRLADQEYGAPYNLAKSNLTISNYMQKQGIVRDNFFIEEGSGLSRKNKVTPKVILYFLHKIKSYREMFPRENGVLAKTGTLTGIYNLAGYIPHKGKFYPFCIFINNQNNYRIEILELLKEWLNLTYS